MNLLKDNLREEETAQTAEESAPELIQKAMGQEGQQEEGLVDKAKDKLAGEGGKEASPASPKERGSVIGKS